MRLKLIAAAGIVGLVAARSSSTMPRPAIVHVPTGQTFVALSPSRHERLLVVSDASGKVQSSIPVPNLFGFAVGQHNRAAYVAVPKSDVCELTVKRVSLDGQTMPDRTVAVVKGGPIDDVQATSTLSPNGKLLAMVVSSPPFESPGVGGPACGGFDQSLAIVNVLTGAVRYIHGSGSESLEDLSWNGGRLLALVMPRDHNESFVFHEMDPETTSNYNASKVLLREGGRYPGPVFGWDGCPSLISAGTIGCIQNGRVTTSRSDHPPTGLPNEVSRVSVAGPLLLIQSGNGVTSTWDSRDNTLHKIPATVPGHWDEPVW